MNHVEQADINALEVLDAVYTNWDKTNGDRLLEAGDLPDVDVINAVKHAYMDAGRKQALDYIMQVRDNVTISLKNGISLNPDRDESRLHMLDSMIRQWQATLAQLYSDESHEAITAYTDRF